MKLETMLAVLVNPSHLRYFVKFCCPNLNATTTSNPCLPLNLPWPFLGPSLELSGLTGDRPRQLSSDYVGQTDIFNGFGQFGQSGWKITVNCVRRGA